VPFLPALVFTVVATSTLREWFRCAGRVRGSPGTVAGRVLAPGGSKRSRAGSDRDRWGRPRVLRSEAHQWLSDLTHQEDPWCNARAGIPDGERGSQEIRHAAMAEYYGSLL